MKKVVVIGPESTGKSTLCQQLAEHYKTLWCPEYAREYLEVNGTDYTYDDLLKIAKGQLALEDEYSGKVLEYNGKIEEAAANHPNYALSSVNSHLSTAPGQQLLFIDTDMYVMKVWCEFVFGKVHQFIIDEIGKRKYDLYLLCNIDLPWVKDALREYPDVERRQQLFDIYKNLLTNQSTPWIVVEGDYEQRLIVAVKAIDAMLIDK